MGVGSTNNWPHGRKMALVASARRTSSVSHRKRWKQNNQQSTKRRRTVKEAMLLRRRYTENLPGKEKNKKEVGNGKVVGN